MPSVVAINISTKKGVAKQSISEANFVENFGIEGDAHGGNWHRQVSLLGQESIDKIKAMGMDDLDSGSFAENITTEGIELYSLPIGTKLAIGETLHEVTQIGKECHQRCAIFHTVGDCVMPREGIFTKVLKAGKVVPGDKIEIL
ncbi:MOSC domain-containing protein [Alkaliphilus oremlandii]|uniref:MOSC domain containing protein n=1 Tax=Alkaliphilus oremlandii (strain OhILAs) TaxID=350688 RepID=A8MGV2_ALKOO|nr:MOSC domain-containing protein [Alkaliphilus oremlandii]ABW18646.1 MOSC domain containing protein [Alkaliphilus oremlandii OhILAs]